VRENVSSHNALLIDYEYCTGCHSCEVACKQRLDLPTGRFGIKLAQNGPWQIDGEKWEWNCVPIPTEDCDLCADRVESGKKPMCVKHCQAFCMQYGPVEHLAEQMVGKKKMCLFVP